THDKTKDDPETWTFYALINANLATLEKSKEALQAAEEGIQKATQLDNEGKNKENIAVAGQLLGQLSFGQGADAFNSQDYKTAYTAFEQALKYLPGDTTLLFIRVWQPAMHKTTQMLLKNLSSWFLKKN